MNLEHLEELRSFYTDLEEKKVICSKCANELSKDTTFLLVGRSFTEAEDRTTLHIRCLIRLFNIFIN